MSWQNRKLKSRNEELKRQAGTEFFNTVKKRLHLIFFPTVDFYDRINYHKSEGLRKSEDIVREREQKTRQALVLSMLF